MWRTCLAGSVVILLSAACQTETPPAPAWSDASTHTEGFVSTASGPLHYLDWGGSGPNLVLIHGLGDNPHVFDDIAPALTGQYRVVAYARRGHGRSAKEGPFDTATLVGDLATVMDTLGIAKAHLAGWSMGGNEITAMAGRHPERVDRIVYLDAGYDWADPAFAAAFQEAPISLTPPAESLSSLDAFRNWQRATWFPGVQDGSRIEAYIRGLVEAAADSTVRMATNDSVTNSLFEALLSNPRDYGKVKAPALSIYAATFFDATAGDSARIAATRQWEEKHMKAFRAASMERIARELPGVEILTVPGTHADFVFTSRDQVVSAMLRFLSATGAQGGP